MNWLDWILLIWFVGVFLIGWRIGLMYRLGNLLGLILGIYLAAHYYSVIANWFSLNHWSQFGVYVVILAGVIFCSGLVAMLLDKTFSIIAWLPFLKSANHLLGGLLGVLVHGIFLTAILIFLQRIELTTGLTNVISTSIIAHALIWCGGLLSWLLPSELWQLQTLF